MPMPKKTAAEHLLSGYYRPSRHGPLPGRAARWRSGAVLAPEPEDDDDSPWKHELRLPDKDKGETWEDVMRQAAEYRARRRRERGEPEPE